MNTIQMKRKNVRSLQSVPTMARTAMVTLLAVSLSATMVSAQQRPTRAQQAKMNAAVVNSGMQPGITQPGVMQPGMVQLGMQPPGGPTVPGPERKADPKPPPQAPPAELGTLPKPVLVAGGELVTNDGVALVGTWFASARGKDATPVLLLSGVGRSRNDYRQLAPMLQSQGFAVLAVNTRLAGPVTFEDPSPDAAVVSEPVTGEADETEPTSETADTTAAEDAVTNTGTAESSPFDEPEDDPAPTAKTGTAKAGTAKSGTTTGTQKTGTAKTTSGKTATTKDTAKKNTAGTAKSGSGKKEENLLQKLRPEDVHGVIEDIETCRQWLARKNNAEELNLNAMCIVAPDAIGLAAIEWMAFDWSGTAEMRQPFVTGPMTDPQTQQSQFSKALVLLSPVASLRNLNFSKAAGSQRILEEGMPFMLCVGTENRDDMREAGTLRRYFERVRKGEEKLKDTKQKTFLYHERETDATSSAMLGSDPQLAMMISQFLREKVATNSGKSIPWNKVRE